MYDSELTFCLLFTFLLPIVFVVFFFTVTKKNSLSFLQSKVYAYLYPIFEFFPRRMHFLDYKLYQKWIFQSYGYRFLIYRWLGEIFISCPSPVAILQSSDMTSFQLNWGPWTLLQMEVKYTPAVPQQKNAESPPLLRHF